MGEEPEVMEEEALAKGTVVAGRYRVVRPLAEGGMGQVYVAHDERVERDVALKVLRREFSARKDLVGRFRREAKSASSVKHESILVFTDCGFDGTHKVYFLCSELLEGEELRALMNRGELTIVELFEVLLQVLSAIEAAHRRGVVHRDLKPENIFVTRDRRGMLVKVLDFGIAKVLDETAVNDMRTRTNVIVGTPGYMSPEQHMALPVDGRTDVFAIGCILYEALSGREPFEGNSLQAITVAMMQGQRRLLTNEELESIVDHALKWKHDERISSARALADALEAYQARHPEITWIAHAPSIPSPTPTPPRATGNELVTPPETDAPVLEGNIADSDPSRTRKPTHIAWSGEATLSDGNFLTRNRGRLAVAGALMLAFALVLMALPRALSPRTSITHLTPTTTVTPTPVVAPQPPEPVAPPTLPVVAPQPPEPVAPPTLPVIAEHRDRRGRRSPERSAHAPVVAPPVLQRRAPHCADARYRYRDGQCCRRRSSGALDCDGEIE